MTENPKNEETLSEEELEEQNGETLPDREGMSTINPGVSGVGSFEIDPLPPSDP